MRSMSSFNSVGADEVEPLVKVKVSSPKSALCAFESKAEVEVPVSAAAEDVGASETFEVETIFVKVIEVP